ncbi:OPT superfamily oligopeptide transporter [Metschnikowia bicuspidata var. bicuspidata NRRL YB-4993]|uniref:OPT superfamily oligopeptide transporter n=1 Tax=Metschnikowia bicuspidata var. bicuspidata NRRL YB-4993 TaxID=869754 RepID=A0A1A0HER9_9ASCO|nr:OPT superfamily oligopeptide transporter [Metschnikowia bicuspidata var. bicuspidata NRRL YB-4993]OBA22496.1 OPT superfamily oligopeptide transporter [Metschnikowia bicuspidata var. bicuspidata NRRL YB-4993]
MYQQDAALDATTITAADARYLLWHEKLELPQVTFRATLVGLVIGSVVLISNFQFGLQTGWVLMMSLPSALLGFTVFKMLPMAATFTDVENVYIQSVAVAVGTGPLAYGLVGIVPAIEKFLTPAESGTGAPVVLSLAQLVVWLAGLAFFGVFFAVTLRKQVIVTEKLPFPSGLATATLISVLHGTEMYDEKTEHAHGEPLAVDTESVFSVESYQRGGVIRPLDSNGLKHLQVERAYRLNIRSLCVTFAVLAAYTVAAYFVPFLKLLPVFGDTMSRVYQWNVQLLPAYIGQGIIMGLPSVSYMMFGAVLGWGVLAPLLKHLGWAPGPIDDWVSGGQGWILWLSLSVMILDSLVSFFVVTARSFRGLMARSRRGQYAPLLAELASSDGTLRPHSLDSGSDKSLTDVAADHLVGMKVTMLGLLVSSTLCVAAIRWVFGALVPYYAIVAAILLALVFSVLGVRALGETDLNPVSGIGKLSQLIFAAIIPHNHPAKILINLIAGGIAEAGAQQAGDLMQDLKTGFLIGASPKAQFVAQLVGTVYSVFFSSVMYKVYNSVYEIPSKTFRIPTAVVWIDCSRLVTGEGLPPHAFEFCVLFGVVFGVISLLKNTLPRSSRYHRYMVYLPNGVAVGIGIYNTPNFSIARFLGGALAYFWIHRATKNNADQKVRMVIISSGLVLGEGLLSGVTMLMTSMGVRHF